MNMKNLGITIYAVSMQNEPDWSSQLRLVPLDRPAFDTVLTQYLEPTFQPPMVSGDENILPEETHWDR